MRKIYFLFLYFVIVAFSNSLFAQCSVSAGSDVSICVGQSTRLTATPTGGPPTTYSWTSIPAGTVNSNASFRVSPTVTTSYIVQITGNGISQ